MATCKRLFFTSLIGASIALGNILCMDRQIAIIESPVGSEESQNKYKILGLNPTASLDDIKKAYKKLATKYHPDKSHGESQDKKDAQEERFKTISDAYSTLSDPATREAYDYEMGFKKGFLSTYKYPIFTAIIGVNFYILYGILQKIMLNAQCTTLDDSARELTSSVFNGTFDVNQVTRGLQNQFDIPVFLSKINNQRMRANLQAAIEGFDKTFIKIHQLIKEKYSAKPGEFIKEQLLLLNELQVRFNMLHALLVQCKR